MPWKKADFKGKTVWAEVDAAGNPKAEGGRQAIRYSDKEGARIYRAGASRVEMKAGDVKELPAGTAADDGGGGAKKRSSSRGSGFGSAGKRSQAQSMAAQAAAHELIQSFSDDVVVCFTDGACQGNPGPAGAGAVVKLPGGEVLERYAALGEATNNVGELTAVELALELIDEADVAADVEVELLTDSKYTFGVLHKVGRPRPTASSFCGSATG